MIIHVLVGQRKLRYAGEWAPEVMVAWDENSRDENPDGFEEECERARKSWGDDLDAEALIRVKVDSDAIEAALYPSADLVGEVLPS